MIGEDMEGAAPTTEQLKNDWADAYGITAPVLSDGAWGVGGAYMSGSLPSQTLLGPGMKIIIKDGYPISDEAIDAVLPNQDAVEVEEE